METELLIDENNGIVTLCDSFFRDKDAILKTLKLYIGYPMVAVISLTCTPTRELKNDIFIEDKPKVSSCVDVKCDSLFPFIDGVDSLVCAGYSPRDYDTVYFTSNVEPFADSAFMRNIIYKFSEKHAVILFSVSTMYPRIILRVKYINCTYRLEFGTIVGHLAGEGWEYELIKVGGRYKIGKVVNWWIS